MEYRNLGSSGLAVSRLIFGGAHIGEIVDKEKAAELVRAAWDVGINAFYTADVYNRGKAEEILGELLKPRREDVVLIVKAGEHVGSQRVPVDLANVDRAALSRAGVAPTSYGLTRKHLTRALEQSLQRLQTDYIDVYAPHFWDVATPIEETLETLDGFVRAGKVRYLGCSRTAAWQLYAALWASDSKQLARYESIQVRFNLLERTAAREILPAAAAADVSVLAFSSLAGGMLSGAIDRGSAAPSGQGYRAMYAEMHRNEQTFELLDRLRALADAAERPLGELAQAWALDQRAVAALLIGPNEPDELAPQAAAVARPLQQSERTALSELLASTPPPPIHAAPRVPPIA
ncbi:MAG TPA: aldo/keto reductase [Solirubrobacteraceae bacterium]|jgi:aryl-alcohol dehydrogenase-like predicted oxidoreductase|nr:aldo/keto reductase [Solirubrobacteraceae bacterium]